MPFQEKKLRNSDCMMGNSTAMPYSSRGGSRKTRTESRDLLGSMAGPFGWGPEPPPLWLLEELRGVLRDGAVHRGGELFGRDVALNEEDELLLQPAVGG